MSRSLYRCLLRIHPGEFRRQFADEMLWIFDEAGFAEGRGRLLGDALRSLVRQWALRSGSWKIAVALVGALVQVTIGGVGQLLFGPLANHGPLRPANHAVPVDVDILLRLALWTVSGIGVGVILLATWVKRFSSRRIRAVHL